MDEVLLSFNFEETLPFDKLDTKCLISVQVKVIQNDIFQTNLEHIYKERNST